MRTRSVQPGRRVRDLGLVKLARSSELVSLAEHLTAVADKHYALVEGLRDRPAPDAAKVSVIDPTPDRMAATR